MGSSGLTSSTWRCRRPLQFAFLNSSGFVLGCSTPAQGRDRDDPCTDPDSRGVVPANTTLGSLSLRVTVPPGVAGPVSQVATVRLTDPGTSTPVPLDYDTDDNTFTGLYPLSAPAANWEVCDQSRATPARTPPCRVETLSFQTNI